MKLQKRIGVIMGKVYKEMNRQQLCGILEQAYSQDISAYVFTLTGEINDKKTRHGELNLFSMINFDLLDGVIFLPYTFSVKEYCDYIQDFLVKNCTKPVISVALNSEHFQSVWYDDRAEFSNVVTHLIDVHGCRKIHCLTGPENEDVSEQRLSGFKDAMTRAGLTFSDEDVTYGDFWIYASQQLAEEIAVGARPKPDAVVCANDIMAAALCDSLAEYGIAIPGDILVAGYDGALESTLHSPTVTTYSTSWRQLGRSAMCALYQKITGDVMRHLHPEEKGTLYCRESCGCNESIREASDEYTFDYQRLEDKYIDSNLSNKLLTSDTLSNFIQKTYHNTYVFLKLDHCGKEILRLCLCEDWDTITMDGYNRTYRTSGYSDQMIWIDFMGTRNQFPSSQMVPIDMEHPYEPSVTFFTAMHFQDRCFGYATLTLLGIVDGFNQHYLRFCREVNNALEFLCIQNELKSLAYRSYLSQIRDDLTGLYNRNSFPQQWEELRKESALYSKERFMIGFSLDGLHRLKEAHGIVEKDKLLTAFAEILQNSCQNQEKCFRAREGEFLIIGSQMPGIQNHETLLQKINLLFEQHYRASNFSCRLRLRHVLVTDCSNLHDSETAFQSVVELLQDTHKAQQSYSEQMHYDDLSALRNDIYQHPEEDWSVALCCQRLNISSSYFQRIYRNTFGVSCAQDIQKSKLDHAKKLLLHTTDTLQTIAKKCGYDYSHFMRTFKKEIGMTPTEYRRGKQTKK